MQSIEAAAQRLQIRRGLLGFVLGVAFGAVIWGMIG